MDSLIYHNHKVPVVSNPLFYIYIYIYLLGIYTFFTKKHYRYQSFSCCGHHPHENFRKGSSKFTVSSLVLFFIFFLRKSIFKFNVTVWYAFHIRYNYLFHGIKIISGCCRQWKTETYVWQRRSVMIPKLLKNHLRFLKWMPCMYVDTPLNFNPIDILAWVNIDQWDETHPCTVDWFVVPSIQK